MVRKFRYKAFISYSHVDKAVAEWLHKALETYRLPRSILKQSRLTNTSAPKLTPIFRDRDELPASGELSVELHNALEQSEFLIVVASPSSAQSQWVNKEVQYFKQHHGDSRVLVVIADGVPGSGNSNECFVPALLRQVSPLGELTEQASEPLAADLREQGDGKRLVKLKLVAGLTGVSLNQLVRRDEVRRQRTLIAYAAVVSVIAISMSVMAAMAVRGQIEADRQRAESDGLIEFMLTDLRDQLEPVGRLEIFDSVGQRALAYFANQDIDTLDADSLGRRARALHLVGEVRDLQADSEGALEAFIQAQQTTGELLARDPTNVNRIYDHSQSTFWVGYVDWQRNEIDAAERRFLEYNQLANQLVSQEPDNKEWQLEQSSSLVNLGVMLHYEGRDAEAIPYFRQALEIDQRLAQADPDDQELRWSVAQGHAWLSDALRGAGDFAGARSERYKERALYSAMLERDQRDARAEQGNVVVLLQIANLDILTGQYRSALDSAQRALDQVSDMNEKDPSNAFWQDLTVSAHNRTVEAMMLIGDWPAAERLNQSALRRAQAMVEADPTVTSRITNGLMNARWMEIAIMFATSDRLVAQQRRMDFEHEFGQVAGIEPQDSVLAWSMIHAMMAITHRANAEFDKAEMRIDSIIELNSDLPRVTALLDFLDGIADKQPWPENRVDQVERIGYNPALIFQQYEGRQ